jgi:predicted metalloenzyme YecM
MFASLSAFNAAAQECIASIDDFALKHDLLLKAHADHICYKCASFESFQQLRALFEKEGSYLFQSIISQRRIAIIRFKEGLPSKLGPINFLELSDQKPDGSQSEGFDHVEVFPVSYSYEEMVADLSKTATMVKVERPHHTTHDIALPEGFIFRCTRGKLIDKIKMEEMM